MQINLKRLIMAFDLKIEIFACKWFCKMVLGTQPLSRKNDVSKVYEDECLACPECYEVSECEYLYEAIMFREWLFEDLYFEEIQTQMDEFRYSQLDFCCYVLRTCNRIDLFGNLTIFERVFATSAFVCCLCCYCFENGYSEIMKYADICWAMYFDNFADEFYKQGGWDRLKMVAVSYKSPTDFSNILQPEESGNIAVIKLRTAIKSYQRFKKIGQIDYDKCISMSWVKYYTLLKNGSFNYGFAEHFEEIHSKALSYEDIETILKQLKYLCDPNGSEIVKSLASMANIDSLKISMSNLNITDKYVNFKSKKEIILSSELEPNITDKGFNVERIEKNKQESVKKTFISTEKITKKKNSNQIREEKKNNRDECTIIESAQSFSSKRCVKRENLMNQNDIGKDQDELKDKKAQKDNKVLNGQMSSTEKNGELENTVIAYKERKHVNSHKWKEIVDKKFFRMLLVLGDKEGIDYVIKT